MRLVARCFLGWSLVAIAACGGKSATVPPAEMCEGSSCPAPAACPAASTIVSGGSCSTSSELGCSSAIPIPTCGGGNDGFVTCTCLGGAWSCPDVGEPDCTDAAPPPPPPTCPDPTQVNVGVSCAASGLDCPGNPQPCGQETFYDSFQCTAGAWVRTVATDCDVGDAG
jgi:hypothetical protein